MFVRVPQNLTRESYIKMFGIGAYRYYSQRIQNRMEEGMIYLNPLKTMYIWSSKDKLTSQGYFTSLTVRNRNNRKSKNFGRS